MTTWVERNPFSVFIGLLAFLLGIFGVAFVAASQPATTPPWVPSEYDARLLALDKEAVDAAYREHVQRLYATWMKDETGQPYRAVTGARQAQRAYVRSMDAIKRRQEELKGGR
jgi:hypothetical protein